MGKRRADATGRRFTDEFDSVRVSRFRAMGIIDPAKRTAIIPFPDGSTKLIGVGHTHLKHGGGWSFFICSGCAKLAQTLYAINDKPLCWRCCDKLNVRHRGKWGMGREERVRAADQKSRPAHQPSSKQPSRSGSTERRELGRQGAVRLSQPTADRVHAPPHDHAQAQSARKSAGQRWRPRAHAILQASAEALAAIPELGQVWRARSTERLEQALDRVQCALLRALESNDPSRRLIAARLMLKTKQARERGFRT